MTDEPLIAVGLIEKARSVDIELLNEFIGSNGFVFSPGKYTVTCKDGRLVYIDKLRSEWDKLVLTPVSPQCRFRIEFTIGIGFHWQQRLRGTFTGGLRFLPKPGDVITVINDVPLESYILSVCCSEMNSNAPIDFLKAHAIISRSWLMSQLKFKSKTISSTHNTLPSSRENEIIRWYDRQFHKDFDVCADDHCQRYQGIDTISSDSVTGNIKETRGIILAYKGEPCDARFSKCCGGITEDYRTAWDDVFHPYLVPVVDYYEGMLPNGASLTDEIAVRDFIISPPQAYCNCGDNEFLKRILNNYDLKTQAFFRWSVKITHEEIAFFLKQKLNLDLGRIIKLEAVERGFSYRIKKLRITGGKGSVVVGKELEIRRILSSSHLYSSAFIVDAEGSVERPDSFVLRGAGWGHGVGLCQIGAAVMACRGAGYMEILSHYYPSANMECVY